MSQLSPSHFLVFPKDKEPAGIIYAEDIQDVVQDLEEAQKDISKVCFAVLHC